MLALCWARLLIAAFPFRWWRKRLGGQVGSRPDPDHGGAELASRLAGSVERAAELLPFETKCLPRAMALSWILRRTEIPHVLVFAVRPAQQRGTASDLHAWIETGGKKVIGDLPGPWIEMLRLGNSGAEAT